MVGPDSRNLRTVNLSVKWHPEVFGINKKRRAVQARRFFVALGKGYLSPLLKMSIASAVSPVEEKPPS